MNWKWMMFFALLFLVCTPIVFYTLNWFWLIHPRQDKPVSADAIVVNAGGRGERLDRAMELMRAGVAPVLVLNISAARLSAKSRAHKLCETGHPDFTVLCVRPARHDTASEGRAFAQIATREGFQHLVLITSDYHLYRATLALRRCFKGTIERVGAGGIPSRAIYLHEWGGILEATFLKPLCGGLSYIAFLGSKLL